MSLKREEVDDLIKKLRDRYRKSAEKHSPVWFDVNAFDERYLVALKNGMNMEGFILAEISNFEKLKEKHDSKKKEKEKARVFSKKVDAIIEENSARVKKYRSIVFDSKCGMEISHLYGAMTDFAERYFPVLWIVVKDNDLRNRINMLDEKLGFFAVPRGSRHARRIEDHINIINRRNVMPVEVEKDRNDYMKECAFLLHEIEGFCGELFEARLPEWDYPVSFSGMFIEEKRKQYVTETFQGLTGIGAILRVQEFAGTIISDFRLGAFKKDPDSF